VKPVRNVIHLPAIGERFRGRSGNIYVCRGILACSRMTDDKSCVEAGTCLGYKAQLKEEEIINTSYCILPNWEVT